MVSDQPTILATSGDTGRVSGRGSSSWPLVHHAVDLAGAWASVAQPNALGFLPNGNGVHYDVEVQRRPLVHRLVADRMLPTTHCTDDGVGLVYGGTQLVEAVSERAGRCAYIVTRSDDGAVEERVEPRMLPTPPT